MEDFMKKIKRGRNELYIPFYYGLFQLFDKPGHIPFYMYLYSYINRDPTNTMKGWSFPPWTLLKKEINLDARTARKYALKLKKQKIITSMRSFIDRDGHLRWKFKLKSPEELLEMVNSSDFTAQKKEEAERNKQRIIEEFHDKCGDSDYFEQDNYYSNNAVE